MGSVDSKYPKVGLEGGPCLVELTGSRLEEFAGELMVAVVVVVVVDSNVSLASTSMITEGMI